MINRRPFASAVADPSTPAGAADGAAPDRLSPKGIPEGLGQGSESKTCRGPQSRGLRIETRYRVKADQEGCAGAQQEEQ